MIHDTKNVLEVNELIRHAAKCIGKGSRQKVFIAIYKGKKAVKTVSDLAKATKLTEKRVLEEGKKLADDRIVIQTKNGKTAYKKDSCVARNRAKILSLINNPKLKSKHPTKQEPKISELKKLTLKVSYRKGLPKPKYQYVPVEDIDSFSKIKKVKKTSPQNFKTLAEQKIKEGFQKILKQGGKFKDWGGEANDLFTGGLIFKGKKRLAAFAFKGKATKGTLKPNMMGKNGDQIARLFGSPAEFFIIAYPRNIDQSIITQMEVFALGRAMVGKTIYYTTIGGSDFAKLYHAYNNNF